MNTEQVITFPQYAGVRCLMMPYIQGEPDSMPKEYEAYAGIIASTFLKKGAVGYITIDESIALKGTPHRGAHARHGRAVHTEVGRIPGKIYGWGAPLGWSNPTPTPGGGWGAPGGGWGLSHKVTLDRDVKILLANNLSDSCALWDAEHEDTSIDGDLGHVAYLYPYETATLMKAGEVHEIGILTPHESLPVARNFKRQFLRIISSGVHDREDYFTVNPLMEGNK